MSRSREPVVLAFSGGKDSSLALRQLRRDGRFEVVGLLTTVTGEYERISMHGVRRSLLREQTDSIGLPLTEVTIPPRASNAIYERAMGEAYSRFRDDGIRRVAFGDIFLEDLREYRIRQLAHLDLECLFPLWKRPTNQLARSFLKAGFRAFTVCIDPAALDPSFVGRRFDEAFLKDLPRAVDPCGENGEFHTFVFDGPVFRRPLAVSAGEVVERDGFWFCDLSPAASETAAAGTLPAQ
jgi:uncharacterized protein (TIGR00290 family)